MHYVCNSKMLSLQSEQMCLVF